MILYLLDDVEHPSYEAIKKLGLGHAFDALPVCVEIQPGTGVDGRSGTLLHRPTSTNGQSPYYRPDRQRWRRMSDRVLVGVQDATTPKSLARDFLIDGYDVKLADDNFWRVPLVRAYSGEKTPNTLLPHYLDYVDGEYVSGEIVEKYAPLQDIACRFWDSWHPIAQEIALATINQETVSDLDKLEYETPIDDAIRLLSANYHIGRDEAILLRLFTDRDYRTAGHVLGAACDCARALSMMITALREKKTKDSEVAVGG